MQDTSSSGAAAAPSQPQPVPAAAPKPPLRVSQMVVTVHGLFDMPRAMTQLDARRELFEIVMRPKAKYYLGEERRCHLELPDQVIPFSPSSILFKHDRFTLDFDNLPSVSRSGSPRQGASQGNSMISSTTESFSFVCNGASVGGGKGVDSVEESGAEATEEELYHRRHRRPNTVVLQYPTRDDLKVIIEVLVGVRTRCINSASVRWITPSPHDSGSSSSSKRAQIATFAAAASEVSHYKVINRFVGLMVGHLSCTVSLPHVREDLRLAPESAALMAVAAARLAQDCEHFARLYPAAPAAKLPTLPQIRERLEQGESELAVWKHIFSLVYPTYYEDRVRRILTMYPPGPQSLEWVQASAEDLVASHKGSEEDLVRHLCAELGPEVSSVYPRTRRAAYRWLYDLSDSSIKACIEAAFPNPKNLLDTDPDVYMRTLESKFGPETEPIRYNFPPISYTPDNRAYFSGCLHFPSSHAQTRDQVLAARSERQPLQITPYERPLDLPAINNNGRRMGEIDFLLYKYKPEFQQIIPSIADAMEAVVSHNESLLQRRRADNDPAFVIFHTVQPVHQYTVILSRLAEYTYVSPSSFLAALIYMDRLAMRYPSLYITAFNVERLLITAVRVASKVVELRSVNNRNFAGVFSIPTAEVNQMEEQLVKLLEFDFFLSPEEFRSYAVQMEPPAALTQMRNSVRHLAKDNLTRNPSGTEDEDDVRNGVTDSPNMGTSGSPPAAAVPSRRAPASAPYDRPRNAASYDGAAIQPSPPLQRPPCGVPVRASVPIVNSAIYEQQQPLAQQQTFFAEDIKNKA